MATSAAILLRMPVSKAEYKNGNLGRDVRESCTEREELQDKS